MYARVRTSYVDGASENARPTGAVAAKRSAAPKPAARAAVVRVAASESPRPEATNQKTRCVFVESRALSLDLLLSWVGRDRRLALGPELVRASRRWHQPRFERGTADVAPFQT